ncbi:MAG: FGGY-family carbohydrate kinase [Phycisphaerae bacterium]
MKQNVIAVLDIGKTNKKTALFDFDLNAVSIEKKPFGEIPKGELMCEQPEAVYEWFMERLKAKSEKYNVKAISITTHGVTMAAVDETGLIAAPVLSYTNEPADDFEADFYSELGSVDELQAKTATPRVGAMINSAKLVYYTKRRFPKKFAGAKHLLFYPQYFVYKLTGSACMEPTMLGCHSYLYEPYKGELSDVAEKMGIKELLPEKISCSWERAGKIRPELAAKYGISADCIVTMGVHDSNSSLLPYIIERGGGFVLNSTGTWCVAMRPASEVRFAEDEIGKLVFYNFDVFKNPVKTSIFMGGMEFEAYGKILDKICGKQPPAADFDGALYMQIITDADKFIMPSIAVGTGLFPHQKARVIEGKKTTDYEDILAGKPAPDFFYDRQVAEAVLNISLAIQSSIAIEHTGYKTGDDIFVEGGFQNNPPYLRLLKGLYPESHLYTSGMAEATSTGAAILALAALNGTTPAELAGKVSIHCEAIEGDCPAEIAGYKDKFLEHLR